MSLDWILDVVLDEQSTSLNTGHSKLFQGVRSEHRERKRAETDRCQAPSPQRNAFDLNLGRAMGIAREANEVYVGTGQPAKSITEGNSNRKRFDQSKTDSSKGTNLDSAWIETNRRTYVNHGREVRRESRRRGPSHHSSSAPMMPNNEEHDKAEIAVVCFLAPTFAMPESSQAPAAWSSRAPA